MNTCQHCKYWHSDGPDEGECRACPPETSAAKWPLSYADDWCGWFQSSKENKLDTLPDTLYKVWLGLILGAILSMFFFGIGHASAEQYVQFPVKEFTKAMERVEKDRTKLSLYQKQNADLKQLATLNKESLAQCDAVNKAREEMAKLDEEYIRELERKNAGLKESIHNNYWFMGGEGVIIAGLIAWILW